MAKPIDPKEVVTLQDLAVSNTYEIAALVAILERKGVLTQQGAQEETKRMREELGKSR